MTHNLKIKEEYYTAVLEGKKRFEIRKNDRGFQIGDIVSLNEVVGDQCEYTGRSLTVRIIYITDYEQKKDNVVFGFEIA